LCATVVRDRLSDVEASSQTATHGGPTASRRSVAARPCTLPVAAVSRPSSLSCCQRVLTCMHCCSVVRTPSSGHYCQRTVSPYYRQAGSFNLLMHDNARAMKDAGSIGSVVNEGRYPRWSRDRSPWGCCGRRPWKTSRIRKN
jgi:hypothetical protein